MLWMELASVLDGESFILHDGMTRVWCVQTVVKNVVGSAKLATSVYADGSCVHGTAFYGAWLFPQFRTKSVKAQDTVVRVVYLGYTAENKGKDGAHHIHCALFIGLIQTTREPPHYQSYGVPHQVRSQTRNNLTLKHKQNLNDAVGFHKPVGHPSANITKMQCTITGVKANYNNLALPGLTEAAVRLYSESGLGSITEAAVVGTVKDDSLTGKINNPFSGGSSGTSATESSTASASENEVEEKLKNPMEKDEVIAVTLILEPVTAKPIGFSTAEERANIEEAVAVGMVDESGPHANAKELRAKRDAIETASSKPKLDLKRSKTGNKPRLPPKSSSHSPKTTALESTRSVPGSRATTEPWAHRRIRRKTYRGRVAGGPYLNERANVQKNLPKYADLVLVPAEMNSGGKKLQSVVRRLLG
ncbi:hypothetical protein RSOLAG22IIIB_06705 [Rhizoctonia solani]|uniref:Uncharacterized protein n=1 Tax=Rhizoctonia solani TaxID=456999 RepID=A0A0K6GGB5_9AGAM|nr:hypothetical protein RSOLAG22IIIB_06705 [Rhizoctonia solani]